MEKNIVSLAMNNYFIYVIFAPTYANFYPYIQAREHINVH